LATKAFQAKTATSTGCRFRIGAFGKAQFTIPDTIRSVYAHRHHGITLNFNGKRPFSPVGLLPW
jgi:hypothetical protein